MSTAAGAPERRIYSVGEFTRRMATLFLRTSALQNIAVAGEVSGLREWSGHLGFTLKEERAVLECVVWSETRRTLPEMSNGMAAIATGVVKVRPDRSGYQLIVSRVEPAGAGPLFQLYLGLKKKFSDEGLFDAARKRSVPPLPRSVALISARGKAMRDFIETLEHEAPFVRVTFVETQVQGEGAEIEIAAAIDDASRMDVDVIVMTRGGGSYEDLFPFNLEPVVRGIVRSRHPVLTAIGHSDDHHLADDAADRYFISPSAAAEQIAQGWVLAERSVKESDGRLDRALRNIFMRAAQRADHARRDLQRAGERVVSRRRELLVSLAASLDRRSPGQWIAQRRERLLKLDGRIAATALRTTTDLRLTLERAGARLDRLDPLAPLARGYAIVTKDGKAVRDAANLRKGDALETRFERGRATAIVESVGSDE